jgi:tRNA(fMet)-specific endonuclease VapC
VHATLPILPYDKEAAQWHARERARLEARGRNFPFVDAQIAAIAAVHELTLVTTNLRDFRAFRDLSVETWAR